MGMGRLAGRTLPWMLLAVLPLIAGQSCLLQPVADTRPLVSDPSPQWVTDEIGKLARDSVTDPPSEITRFVYQGQTVYLVSGAACCDTASPVYDSDKNLVCIPYGGITGAGDGNCPDFSQQATQETLIWRDTRRR